MLSKNAPVLAFLQHILLRRTAEGKSNGIKDMQVLRNDTLGFVTLLQRPVQSLRICLMELLLSRENTANTHPLLERSDRSYCSAGHKCIHIYTHVHTRIKTFCSRFKDFQPHYAYPKSWFLFLTPVKSSHFLEK